MLKNGRYLPIELGIKLKPKFFTVKQLEEAKFFVTILHLILRLFVLLECGSGSATLFMFLFSTAHDNAL